MKRSEMIANMIEMILALDNPKPEPLTYWQKANYLLHEMEEDGMLPPFVDQAVIPEGDYFTMHVDEAAYSGVCKWEPEEETKQDQENAETNCVHSFEPFDAYYEQCKLCGKLK